MITIIWLILSLFGVCSFTWLPIFLDTLIVASYLACKSSVSNQSSDNENLMCIAALSVSCFAFYKFFYAMTISGWWILLAPIAFVIVALFPGGFTIINLLFDKAGWITLPTWGLILGIVIDIFILVVEIASIIESVKNSKNK